MAKKVAKKSVAKPAAKKVAKKAVAKPAAKKVAKKAVAKPADKKVATKAVVKPAAKKIAKKAVAKPAAKKVAKKAVAKPADKKVVKKAVAKPADKKVLLVPIESKVVAVKKSVKNIVPVSKAATPIRKIAEKSTIKMKKDKPQKEGPKPIEKNDFLNLKIAKSMHENPPLYDYSEKDVVEHAPLTPIVRDIPKIGRNEPCHCGSGLKYKKCHGKS